MRRRTDKGHSKVQWFDNKNAIIITVVFVIFVWIWTMLSVLEMDAFIWCMLCIGWSEGCKKSLKEVMGRVIWNVLKQKLLIVSIK